jgi:glycosyltransferase involved in cell wall biosynthesis
VSREEGWRAAARARFERHRADFAAADVGISPSRFLARQFEAAGFESRQPIEVLKAGYPGPRFPVRRRDPSRALRVGYVGGVYFSKGVHVLVQAFQHLRDDPVELSIHGHLDWFPDYVAELERAAAGARVRFAGPFAPAEVDRVLSQLELLVLPSVWYENMPITIHEAHRHGIPVIVTDLGGMAEAVEHGVSGLTFPRGDALALADRIASLARDPALYDRIAQGRPRVPTLEEVVDRLELLYANAP